MSEVTIPTPTVTATESAMTLNALPALLAKSRVAKWLYGHRKFLVFCVSMLVLVLNQRLKIGLDNTTLEWLAGLASAYMVANVGEHFADALKLKMIMPLLHSEYVNNQRMEVLKKQ